MPDPTENRGYSRPDAGVVDWHIPLNDTITAIDEDVQNAFDAIDGLQGGGGGDITTSNVVVDTGGREHGELDGNNDADVVVDAIADRIGESAVIVPDPGFALDWNRQVDTPANEPGFSLLSDGLPTLDIPSGFSGTHAIRKPGTGSQVQGYRIGGFEIIDGPRVLDPAISISDLKESVIHPSLFWDCPAIELLSDNDTFTNQNKILYPFIKRSRGDRGPGIFLGGDVGTADQNWIYSPHYIETDFTNPSSVAYHDEGAFNSWIFTRAESADTVHLFDGCREYYVSEGGWDRVQAHRRTVEERNGARGKIELREASRYEAVDVTSAQTRIECRGRFRERTNPLGRPVDILDDLARVTTARSLESMGLRDGSNGGSVEINETFFDHPFLRFSTGSGAAILDLGPGSMKTQALPKAAYSFGPLSLSSDGSGVLVRHGFYAGENNRVELIYDPSNEMGGHGGDTWYFEAANNGSVTRENMGIGIGQFSGERQVHSLCHVKTGTAGPGSVWVADIETQNKVRITDGPQAKGTWQWYVESLNGSNKRWAIEPRDGHRLYRC